MQLLSELTHPILQAPIGSAASVDLAAAVAGAGGMGCLAMTWTEPEIAVQQVRRLRQTTDGLFSVNFVLAFSLNCFEAVLDEGVPVVTLSWGMAQSAIDRAHASGAAVGIQVGSAEAARKARQAGADFLICQGLEAGGHVQSSTPLAQLLVETRAVVGSTPLVAAGGLADGHDLAWALDAGASAAMFGTRFVATHESAAHLDYKRAIVAAAAKDTACTLCFDGDWPYAGHRVLRNSTLEQWEAAGCPPAGHRPGDGEKVATTIAGWHIPRYHIASPKDTTVGEVLDLALYAGTGCEKIVEILPAGEVVKRLMAQCRASRPLGFGPGSARRLESTTVGYPTPMQ